MDDLFNDSDELNESQKDFLAKLEEQFCDRFTDKDEDFMKVMDNQKLVPPILAPWERSFRDRRFNRKRRRDDDYGSRDNYGKSMRYDRDDNRHGRRYDNYRHDDRHSHRYEDRRYDNNSENYNRNRNYR